MLLYPFYLFVNLSMQKSKSTGDEASDSEGELKNDCSVMELDAEKEAARQQVLQILKIRNADDEDDRMENLGNSKQKRLKTIDSRRSDAELSRDEAAESESDFNDDSDNGSSSDDRGGDSGNDGDDDDDDSIGTRSGVRLRPKYDDVDKGETIYVRNIPYDATVDEIKSAFTVYGPIVYARLLKTEEGKKTKC